MSKGKTFQIRVNDEDHALIKKYYQGQNLSQIVRDLLMQPIQDSVDEVMQEEIEKEKAKARIKEILFSEETVLFLLDKIESEE